MLCHGGPIAQPADARYIIDRCPDCHGFYGASSMERLPTEVAIIEQTRQFKRIERGAGRAGRRVVTSSQEWRRGRETRGMRI